MFTRIITTLTTLLCALACACAIWPDLATVVSDIFAVTTSLAALAGVGLGMAWYRSDPLSYHRHPPPPYLPEPSRQPAQAR